MTRARWIGVAIVVLALIFALEGGEYSTWDWWKLRGQEKEEKAAVTGLQRTVDSLDKVLKGVQTDPRVQERIAREQYGMIRKGEFLYRLVPQSDSSGP
jgi:cell division protein FtsB